MKSVLKKLVARALHRQLSRLDDFYQRHAGEECYIFGNGSSLKWMDLRLLADRPSIMANFSVYHKQANEMNIPYCTSIEPYFFYPYFPFRRSGKFPLIRHYIYREYHKWIAENPKTLFFLDFSNYPIARFPNAVYISRWYKPSFEVKNPFRDRPDAYEGTLKFQLSLAIFLGFKKAYLVGHDYTHYPTRNGHFYEKGQGDGFNWQHHLKQTYKNRQEYLDYAKRHIDLVTVTLDGTSTVMDFVTYKELTGKAPCFRENHEIVDREKLENLATWHAYSIF